MRRKRGWRWAKLVGQVTTRAFASAGAIHFCLPPPSVIEQWPADGGMWTPEPQLAKSDRRAWAAIEASLRDDEGGQ